MRLQRLAVASIVLAFVSSAEATAQKLGTTELGVFGQFTRADAAWHTDDGFGLGGRLGIFLNRRWELEGTFSASSFNNQAPRASGTSSVQTFNGQLNFNLPFGFGGQTHDLILEGGVGGQRFASHTDFSAPYGGGLRVRFNDAVALRLDGIVEYVENPTAATFGFPPIEGKNPAAARSTNVEVRAGLSLLLGSSKAPPSPPPAPVVQPQREAPPPRTEPPAPPMRIAPPLGPNRDSADAVNRAREALVAPVYFDFDQSELRPDQRAVLDAKLPVMKANSGVRIRIEGNADERGSDEYNLALGMRRAQATRKYLIDNGIDASRIDVASNGEEKPVCQGHDEDCWKQNRRDEFVIVVGGSSLVAPK
jgi:peptidoglycan-associated lipoprotein